MIQFRKNEVQLLHTIVNATKKSLLFKKECDPKEKISKGHNRIEKSSGYISHFLPLILKFSLKIEHLVLCYIGNIDGV